MEPKNQNLVEHALMWLSITLRDAAYDPHEVEQRLGVKRVQFEAMNPVQLATGVLMQMEEMSGPH